MTRPSSTARCRLRSRADRHQQPRPRTFETTLATSERAGAADPARPHRWSAKAASSRPPIWRGWRAVGMSTFLVGESLMRQADVAAATRALLARARRAQQRAPGARLNRMARKRRQDNAALTHIDAQRRSAHGRRLGQARDRTRRGRGRPRGHAARRRSTWCVAGNAKKGDVLGTARHRRHHGGQAHP